MTEKWVSAVATCENCITYDVGEKGQSVPEHGHNEVYKYNVYPEFKYARNALTHYWHGLMYEYTENCTLSELVEVVGLFNKLTELKEEAIPREHGWHIAPPGPYSYIIFRLDDIDVIPKGEGISFELLADHSECTVEHCKHFEEKENGQVN